MVARLSLDQLVGVRVPVPQFFQIACETPRVRFFGLLNAECFRFDVFMSRGSAYYLKA